MKIPEIKQWKCDASGMAAIATAAEVCKEEYMKMDGCCAPACQEAMMAVRDLCVAVIILIYNYHYYCSNYSIVAIILIYVVYYENILALCLNYDSDSDSDSVPNKIKICFLH
jgi:hypothetical protein